MAKTTLTPQQQAALNVQNKAKSGIGVTHHTSGKVIKGLAAQPVIAKPQRRMLRYISAKHGHPGKGNCIKRYHLYKVGTTLLQAKTTKGMVASDLTFYAQLGYITLSPCTNAQYNAAIAAWQKAKAGKAQ